VLIAGAHDGTILDRGGRPYKPSTARGYEQLLRSYVVPELGGWKLSQVQRRDVQDFVDDLRKEGLSASTIANILDPLRVIFRRAIRRDEISIDPTDNLDLPAIRGRRDRIEPPERAHEYVAALSDSERAFWAVALFCGPRRGELRGLQWTNVDFEGGVNRIERSWDPVKGPVDVKTGAGRRAVPMAFVVRRELMAHKARTGSDGPDLVFGRTATEVFYASTIRARANKAWKAARLEPITPHEARHCAISYFIAAGLDWKQISTWRVTAMSARPGTATATSSPAARTRQESVSMRSSCRHNRPRLWRTLWRTTPRTTKPPKTRGFCSTATARASRRLELAGCGKTALGSGLFRPRTYTFLAMARLDGTGMLEWTCADGGPISRLRPGLAS